MNKFVTIAIACALLYVVACGQKNEQQKAPYEATWLKIIKMDNSYAVLNYPNLLDSGKTKTLEIFKAERDSMIWITFDNEPMIFKYKDFNVVKLNDSSYEFNSKTEKRNSFSFRFDYVDKSNHIAQWSVYYAGYLRDRAEVYIDSLYNTFPMVEVEVKFDEPDESGY